MKVIIHKLTAEGEQLQIETDVPTKWLEQAEAGKLGLYQRIKPALDLLDDRLREMNGRILEMNRLFQGLSPEARVAVVNMLDVLRGIRAGVEQPQLVIQPAEAGQVPGGVLEPGLESVPGGVGE